MITVHPTPQLGDTKVLIPHLANTDKKFLNDYPKGIAFFNQEDFDKFSKMHQKLIKGGYINVMYSIAKKQESEATTSGEDSLSPKQKNSRKGDSNG